ncbi:protein tramtrack, beta isoform-like isoform X7 [Photinus pyralis]|uniref:BTB domain-containing protein n=1 Tax=Photinus pyralis TaxID=7054 RepID=A0A1Y1K4D4_PHOPY|nr:protein tramtrack, beta isoform-like isoform X7 [Photinus pyralis]
MKMASEQFSLCWDNFHRNMSMGMQSLLENEVLVDVTLAIEGRYLKAHKMVLSVCSPYFRELFQSNPCKHPIVFMKDVSYVVLMDLLQFMYQGEVQVAQENLSLFIKTAEALQIKGLTGDNEGQTNAESEEMETAAVDTKKATSRPKKFSGPASKKPKLNPIASSHVKTLPVISSASKFEVTSVNTNSEVTEDVSNFKPEPTEAANEQQSDTETMNDSQIDQYADYANAEDNGDDGDDFSMADTTIDEPKASTSTDIGGGSDNQGLFKFAIQHTGTHDLVLHQHIYRYEKLLNGKKLWVCSYSSECPAKCYTASGKLLSKIGTHNHLPPKKTIMAKEKRGLLIHKSLD